MILAILQDTTCSFPSVFTKAAPQWMAYSPTCSFERTLVQLSIDIALKSAKTY